MAKKKLLHLIGWISLIIVTTANINAVANNDVGGYIDGNVGDNIGSDINKQYQQEIQQEVENETQKSLKKEGVFKEENKIARAARESVNKERNQHGDYGYGNLQNFKRGEKLENEKLADEIFKKVKVLEKEYEKIQEDVDEKVKGQEEWAKRVVKDTEKSIYAYSQNRPKTINNEVLENYLEGYSQILKSNKTDEGLEDGFYIAVSLSMPQALLVSLHNQAIELGGRLIMRGLKNNSFKETVSAIKELSESGIVVDINPKIFRSYEIKQVPTFVLIGNGKSDVMSGNVSLGYVLEEFKNRGDTSGGLEGDK